MIFDDPSTRTRISFETGMTELGGHAVYLRPGEMHLPGRESVADTGRVLSRFLHAIMARTQTVAVLRELADAATVPVINGEAGDWDHPIQSVSDALTILEYGGRLEGETMAWLGNGDCMCNSVRAHASAARHERERGHAGALPALGRRARGWRRRTAGRIRHAAPGRGVTPRRSWPTPTTSTPRSGGGRTRRSTSRTSAARTSHLQVNEALWAQTKPGARFMHCLPAVRGDEVTDAIIDGPASMVWDMAENRKHLQKAVVLALVGIDRLPDDPALQPIGRALLS